MEEPSRRARIELALSTLAASGKLKGARTERLASSAVEADPVVNREPSPVLNVKVSVSMPPTGAPVAVRLNVAFGYLPRIEGSTTPPVTVSSAVL